MAEKKAKTAHGKEKVKFLKPCPICGKGLVATKHAKTAWSVGSGIFWDCSSGDYSERVRK
jgi:ssDNA-binding Zn-finger/Zn-ribbon topoisomerase 1